MTDADPISPPIERDSATSSEAGERPEPAPVSSEQIQETFGVPRWVPGSLILITLFVFGSVAAWFILGKLRDLLVWLFVALFASFALEPAVNWLAKRGWRRGLATGVILFGLIILGFLVIGAMVPLVASQVRQLINELPNWLNDISARTQDWFGFSVSIDDLRQRLASADSQLESLATNALGVGAKVLSLIFVTLTIGLFTFYMTAEGPRFRRALLSAFPPKVQAQVLWTWDVAIEKTGGYLYSRLLLAIVSTVGAFIAFSIIGIPFALPLALWMGFVSQFIPTVGTYIASALPILVALLSDPIDALWVVIYITVYQQLENYLLAPKVTARTMSMNAAVAFGSVIAGGLLLGPIGAFVAIPAAAIIQALLSAYVARHRVVEDDLTREHDHEVERQEKKEEKQRSGSGLIARFLRRSRTKKAGSGDRSSG